MTLAEANMACMLNKVRAASQLLEAAIQAGRDGNDKAVAKLMIEAKRVLDEAK